MNYWYWMAGSALLCTGLWCLLGRKGAKAPQLCLLSLVFGSLLGAVMAKLTYYLTQIDFMIADGWLRSLVNPDPAQFCFFGGCIGVVLGVCLAAKVLRLSPVAALDSFAPVGAVMAALSRFSGYFLQEDMIGLGAYMDDPALCFFPLTVVNQWEEHYLAVFMIEGAIALVVAAFSFLCFKEKRFLRTVFYLCLPQIFCESLHNDSISWLFVRVEQLFAMLTMAAVMIRYSLLLAPGRKRWLPFAVCLICAGIFVAVEFALDKSSWPIPAIYAAMILGLAVLGIAEHKTLRMALTDQT